ncbi:substrate-binding periplasmic protein [Brumicola nitratireducens]|nr:transporter substrate-binding domain-containing protein [Glaciecola nitratireducens]
MKRCSNIFVALFTSMLVFSGDCQSFKNEPSPSLNFGYSEFAPYTYTDENGMASGEVSNIIRKVVSESDFEFEAIPGPNRRLFRSLVTDNIDLLMVVPFEHPDSHKLIFGEKVFDILEISVFWLEGNTPPINLMSQLQGKPLITIAGYSYGGLFRGEGALVTTERFNSESHPQALKALSLGRAPYLLSYHKPAMFYFEPEPNVKLSSHTLEVLPLVLSIRRSYPNAEKVLKELETRYAALFPERFLELNPNLPKD